MPLLSSILTNLSSFLQDHHVSFSNAILILLTIGGEQIFKLGDFKCPCDHPHAWLYAFAFFFVPTVVLAVMGLAVSNLTWRVLHGCCNRTRGKENGPEKVATCFATVSARSTVVPVAWLFLMFMDGSFFACMQSNKPCETDSDEYKSWKITSQIIGWCILLVAVVVSFTVITMVRCCDSVTYNQNKYMLAYREAEEKEFIVKTQEHAGGLAKKFVKDFIETSDLTKSDWDEISVAPSMRYAFPPLSPLHQWTRVKNQTNQQYGQV